MDMDWLFPYAAGTAAEPPVTTAAIAVPSEPGSPSSSAGGGGNKEAGSCSSPSAASSSSSTSGHFNHSTSRRQSPPASPLCFRAGGAGMLLWSSSKAPARASRNPVGKAAPNGDVVGRFLRRISRRLRKARAAASAKESPPPRGGAGADDTARERAEAVASAVAYCKETLRRGTPLPPPPLPLSSPSLDCWLHDMREEIIASAAAQRDDDDDECRDRDSSRPRRDRSFPLKTQAEGTPCDEHSPRWEGSLSAGSAAALCDESPHHGHLTGYRPNG